MKEGTRGKEGQQSIVEAQQELARSVEADASEANKHWRDWVKKATEELGGSAAFKFLKAQPGEGDQDDPELEGVPQAGAAAMEVVLQAWMPLWAKESRRREPRPSSWRKGEALPRITGDQVREVLSKYPQGTGLGWDRLHPKALEQLPKGYCDRLAEILNLWEADAHPMALWSMVTVFLAKPDGG